MAWDKGFNFRATVGFVTDGTNEQFVAGSQTYPTTNNGVTYGWDANISGNDRDRDNTNDRRLAGVNSNPNLGTRNTFRVDLPATGQYIITLAMGDTSSQAFECIEFQDNTTSFLTLTGIVNLGTSWADNTGTQYTNATWPGSHATLTRTFTSTIFNVILGSTTAQANSSPIAHLFISQVASGASLAWVKA